MPITVHEIGMAMPDTICIQILDEAHSPYPLYGPTSQPAGGTITGIVANAAGGMRITVASAKNYTHEDLLSIKGATNNGSGLIRIEVYSTSDLTNGQTVYAYNAGGVPAADGTWVIAIIDGTHFDLNGSTFSGTYTFGGFISGAANDILEPTHIRGVVGTTEANGWQWTSIWSATELDIIEYIPRNSKLGWSTTHDFEMKGVPQFQNSYVSGGTVCKTGGFETLTNPFTGAPNQTAYRVGRSFDFLRFQSPGGDNPYEHLDRVAADNVANYGTIGGLTVTAVYPKSKPYQQTENLFAFREARMWHFLFLKLSGNLSQAAHTIDLTFLGFGVQNFTFNDKVSRAVGIHATQLGHRPSDANKKAFLSLWVPGAPDEGAVDFSDYSLIGANKAKLIDQSGTVVHSFDVTLRLAATDVEASRFSFSANLADGVSVANMTDNGSGAIRITLNASTANSKLTNGCRVLVTVANGVLNFGVPNAKGVWTITKVNSTTIDLQGSTFAGSYTSGAAISSHHAHSSVTNKVAITGIDHTVVPCRVSATGHGLTSGDLFRLEGIGAGNIASNRHPFGLEGGSDKAILFVYKAVVIDANTVDLTDYEDVAINVTSSSAWAGGGYINKLNKTNGAGTNVYNLDYSAYTGTGLTRVYIPGLGVSDEFRIDDAVWADAAAIHAAGEYHNRNQCDVDGRFGTTYPYPTYMDGVDGTKQFRSTMPLCFSSQKMIDASGAPTGIPSGQGGMYPWVTTNRISIVGGHMDAADSDSFVHHVHSYYDALEVWEQCPGARSSNFGLPKASETIGGIWVGTDVLNGLIQTAIHGVDLYRQAMDVNGITISGQMASSIPAGVDVGQNYWEPSYIHHGRTFTFAGDHYANYIIAGTLAKLSRCLTIAGLTSQALTVRNAAILGYSWADSMLFSAPNSAGARDTYYKTTLGLQTKTGWSDAQYLAAHNGIDSAIAGSLVVGSPTHGNTGVRAFAAANLFRLTGEAAYQDDWLDSFPSGATFGEFVGRAWWEMAHASPTGAAATMVTNNEGQFNSEYNAFVQYYSAIDFYGNPVPGGTNAYENIQNQNTGYPVFGGWGTSLQFAAWVLMHAHIRSAELNAGVYDPKPLAILQAGLNHNNGANQMGVSFTSGLGVRDVKAQFFHNRNTFGDGIVPRGIQCLGYKSFANIGATAIFNFTAGTSNQTNNFPDNVTYAGDSGKTVTPHDLACPLLEPMMEAYLIIASMEFGISGNLVPPEAASMYASAWDGNSVEDIIYTGAFQLQARAG